MAMIVLVLTGLKSHLSSFSLVTVDPTDFGHSYQSI
jgi:hypothetical protein